MKTQLSVYFLLSLFLIFITDCTSVPSPNEGPRIESFKGQENIPAGFPISVLRKTFYQAELLAEKNYSPLYYTVYFLPSVPNTAMAGSYDLIQNRLNLTAPQAGHSRWNLEQQAYFLSIAAVHELGHSVFENYMLNRTQSIWGKIAREDPQLSREAQYQSLRFMRLSYHELFADIFARLYFDQASILKEYANTSSSSVLDSNCRDFAKDCTQFTLKSWQKNLRHDFSQKNPDRFKYLFFGPARAGIEEMIPPRLSLTRKQELLAQFAATLAEDFDERWSQLHPSSLSQLNPWTYNQDLIQRIRKRLQSSTPLGSN